MIRGIFTCIPLLLLSLPAGAQIVTVTPQRDWLPIYIAIAALCLAGASFGFAIFVWSITRK